MKDEKNKIQKLLPKDVLSEKNLEVIEENHKIFKQNAGKRVQDFLLEDSRQTIYTAEFINLNKLRIKDIGSDNVFFLVKQSPEHAQDFFTLATEFNYYSIVDRSICESCLKRQDKKIDSVTISYLCESCQKECPNSYILRKGKKKFLVVAEDPAELVSLEI